MFHHILNTNDGQDEGANLKDLLQKKLTELSYWPIAKDPKLYPLHKELQQLPWSIYEAFAKHKHKQFPKEKINVWGHPLYSALWLRNFPY